MLSIRIRPVSTDCSEGLTLPEKGTFVLEMSSLKEGQQEVLFTRQSLLRLQRKSDSSPVQEPKNKKRWTTFLSYKMHPNFGLTFSHKFASITFPHSVTPLIKLFLPVYLKFSSTRLRSIAKTSGFVLQEVSLSFFASCDALLAWGNSLFFQSKAALLESVLRMRKGDAWHGHHTQPTQTLLT